MTQQESLDELDHGSIGPDLIIITGMSGAGRTEAMHTFEDIGYFCIDNLPPSLIMNLVSLAGVNSDSMHKLAVVCDLRSKDFFPELTRELEKLKEMGLSYKMLFLDSSDEALLNRFKATRRRHPLADRGMTIIAGIRKERQLLAEARRMADFVIDTSSIRPNEMREKIRELFTPENAQTGLGVSVYSFGFKHGAATDADILIDVRFLPNPFYEPELRDKTGMDKDVQDFILTKPETQEFLKRWYALLDCVMPGYVKEGKQYLSIAIGCTGGQHRSVVLANVTGQYLSQAGYQVTTTHRDLALAEVHK
ncbi:MAG: RNase adapter RapZ [Coriobacteriales bacterium]|jgi:UPF0042 nucleotide-binding protein